MANKKSSQPGDGIAWVLLILCLIIIGSVALRSNFKESKPQKETSSTTLSVDPEDLFAALPTESLTVPTTESLSPPASSETETASPSQAELPFSPSDPLLILVNRDHPMPEDAEPESVAWPEGAIRVGTAIYEDLQAMLRDGRQMGLRFTVCSGYRTLKIQQQLFDEDLNRHLSNGMSYEEAWATTAQYTMPPGCSEHSTGLAVDIVSQYNQNLDSSQETTAETRWLHAHCWEYGFILRYPNDKSEITGIAYESWHYRYVGREAAKYLTENGLTLEEFHQQYGSD